MEKPFQNIVAQISQISNDKGRGGLFQPYWNFAIPNLQDCPSRLKSSSRGGTCTFVVTVGPGRDASPYGSAGESVRSDVTLLQFLSGSDWSGDFLVAVDRNSDHVSAEDHFPFDVALERELGSSSGTNAVDPGHQHES